MFESNKKTFIAELEEKMNVTFVNDNDGTLYFRSIASNSLKDAYIKILKKDNDIPDETLVIVEYPTKRDAVKYVLHGERYLLQQFAKDYGGFVDDLFWYLYNSHRFQQSLNKNVRIEDIPVEFLQKKAAEFFE